MYGISTYSNAPYSSLAGGGTIVIAITGNAATGAVGNVAPGKQFAITGNFATGDVGSVGIAKDIAVIGNQANGQVGTPGVNSILALSGNQANGAVGNVIGGGSYFVPITGVSVSGLVDGVGPSVPGTATMLGFVSVGGVGNVGVVQSQELTGVTATGSVGSVGVEHTVALNTVISVIIPGTVVANVTLPITGVSAAVQEGIIAAYFASLSNVSATGSVGTLGVSTSITRQLTGVSANGQVGSIYNAGWQLIDTDEASDWVEINTV